MMPQLSHPIELKSQQNWKRNSKAVALCAKVSVLNHAYIFIGCLSHESTFSMVRHMLKSRLKTDVSDELVLAAAPWLSTEATVPATDLDTLLNGMGQLSLNERPSKVKSTSTDVDSLTSGMQSMGLSESPHFKLRPYQENVVKDIMRVFDEKESRSVLLYLPTGAGKTVVATDIITRFSKQVLPCICSTAPIKLTLHVFISSG